MKNRFLILIKILSALKSLISIFIFVSCYSVGRRAGGSHGSTSKARNGKISYEWLCLAVCSGHTSELKQHQAALWVPLLPEQPHRRSVPGVADSAKIFNIKSNLLYFNFPMLHGEETYIHYLHLHTLIEECV